MARWHRRRRRLAAVCGRSWSPTPCESLFAPTPACAANTGCAPALNPTFGDWISPLELRIGSGSGGHDDREPTDGSPMEPHATLPYIWRGLRQAGFAGGWLESEREPQCPPSVEGRWRERGTPFSKLSESATPGNARPSIRRPACWPRESTRTAIPPGSRSCRLPDPSRGADRFWSA